MPPNPPPPYKRSPPDSLSRTRTPVGDIESMADAMLRASLSRSSVNNDPRTVTRDRATPTARPSSSRPSSSRPSAPRPSRPTAGSASATTSRTRNRLREVERELEEQRAVAERLKREVDVKEPTAEDARLRFLDLKREANAAGFNSSPRSTTGMFKAACSTDLLFLIDTTGSMWSYIQAAKDQVKSIAEEIEKAFLGEAEIRIAVVGYKDHDDKPNIEFLDFTSCIDDVRTFLDRLEAGGGDDVPEDVLGGIRQAINATWKHQTRTIIHIADAPAHGRIFHNLGDEADHYPEPGTEPHRLVYQPLFKKMIGMNVNYVLLRINELTDRMSYLFLAEYAAVSAESRLHKENMYYNEGIKAASAARWTGRRSLSTSRTVMQGSVQFQEMTLGTSYSSLRDLVVKSVTSSASRTAVRLSSEFSRAHAKLAESPLTRIGEDASYISDELLDVPLEEVDPQWDTPGWLDESLTMEGFSPDVVVHSNETLTDMMADDDNIKLSIMELSLRKRSMPFAQGAMRTAAYGRLAVSTNKYVVKANKKDGKKLAHLAEDMRCQALCKAFALEFNALNSSRHAIDFIVTTCLKGKKGGDANCLSLEPYIPGEYVKYNNNSGYCLNDDKSELNLAAQAFSHYTFERSWGRFLVCDLQGVGRVLTDPAIHTLDPERFKLADGNLGKEGFKFFFASHQCNDVCRKLKLKSNATGLVDNNLQFRERWPTMDSTACCSNKLCGRIVLVSNTKKSDEFPGRQWCDVCWPQLESSKVSWICAAPGLHHEFLASKFFFESQGRIVPHKCSEHRSPEPSASRTAVVGRTMWNKLNDASKKKTVSGRAW